MRKQSMLKSSDYKDDAIYSYAKYLPIIHKMKMFEWFYEKLVKFA